MNRLALCVARRPRLVISDRCTNRTPKLFYAMLANTWCRRNILRCFSEISPRQCLTTSAHLLDKRKEDLTDNNERQELNQLMLDYYKIGKVGQV